MATFAPPTRRGDFLYSSVLYADAGNSNHHPRASVADLAALLRPEAPNLYNKGRKPETSSPAKDPPWHFYSAQLIHYGLPVIKDKNGAKVRLLTAMNQFKLEVPAWVLKVEGELKKEWEAENRKIKKSARAVVGPINKVSSKGKANTTPSMSSGVNVTLKLTLSSPLGQYPLCHSQGPAPQKSPPAKRKRAVSFPPAKATTVKSERTPTKRVKKEPASKTAAPRLKQEQAHSSPANTPSRSHVKQEYVSPSTQRSKYISSPYIKTEPYADFERNRDILLSGTYEVNCATASDMFGAYDLELMLSKDSFHDVWWVTFRWGPWDGIMQIDPGPDQVGIGNPCTLGWRLRDLETGQLKFGKRCAGAITFFDDQTFTGALYEVPGAGTVEFEGTRLAGRGLEDDLQHEWDAFVSEAYGR